MPSYVSSKAQSSQAAQIAINTGSPTTPAYTAIGEIIDWSFSGDSWDTLDTTNILSSREEFVKSIKKAASLKLTGNRVGNDTGYLQVETDFAAGTAGVMFQITLPKTSTQTTTGDVFTFTGLITDRDFAGGSKKLVAFDLTIKLSSDLTLAAGS